MSPVPEHARDLSPEVRDLYPFESRHIKLRCGHRMHYLDEGQGPPLLMLHGNPTWSFYYRTLILGLRDRYRCIAPDHIGCGLSDKPQDWSYDIPAHVANLCELLATLDLRATTLMVHDWGGPIGYLAAQEHPDRFSRLVTFNTALSLLPLPRELTFLRLPIYGSIVVRGLNGLLRAGLSTSVEHPERFGPGVRSGYFAPYDSWAHRIAILRFVQEIPMEEKHPNRKLLADLDRSLDGMSRFPHLVIWGLKDRVFHRDYLSAWRERFPQAEVHAFEDASHWVVDEVPERALPLVREFLSRTDVAGSV
jgi:haloalkane dehalogenase